MEVLEEVGPFELHRLIGSGGAGHVYEATDRRTARTVAVKLLSPEVAENEQVRARFLREAKHAARIEDPHAVPIYDYGDIDGRMYIAMKHVEGQNLAQLVGHGPLPAARAVRIISQVASALASAHKQGLVHRDVKPSNILLTTDQSGRDFAYLADFGIMRSVAGDTTSLTAGFVVGTVDYMAPEQFSGTVDARSDTYALGCVLFTCLTGRVPFPQDAFEAKLTAKLWGTAPKVSDVAPWVGDHLDAVGPQGPREGPERSVQVGLSIRRRSPTRGRHPRLPAQGTHHSLRVAVATLRATWAVRDDGGLRRGHRVVRVEAPGPDGGHRDRHRRSAAARHRRGRARHRRPL